MLIGDVPSRSEETAGKPFQGRSGLMLDALLAESGFKTRAAVRSTYAVLCRPNIMKGKWRDYEAWLRLQNRNESKQAKAEKRPPELHRNPAECCFPRLHGEVKEAQAAAKAARLNAVIMPLGGLALRTLTRLPSIFRYRGSALPVSMLQEPVPEPDSQEIGDT